MTIEARLAEILGLQNPGPEMVLADLGLDSLRMVDALFRIEEAFDISISYDVDLTQVETFGALVAQVESLVRG